MDGGPGRQAKACQHGRLRGLTGAHGRRHTMQERCDKIQTLQLHAPRGHTAQGSCRVEQEWDNTSRGSNMVSFCTTQWLHSVGHAPGTCMHACAIREDKLRPEEKQHNGRQGPQAMGINCLEAPPELAQLHTKIKASS